MTTPRTVPPDDPAASAAAELLGTPLSAFGVEGHFDELRGRLLAPGGATQAEPSPPWAAFFEPLRAEGPAALNWRSEALQRQIRDNGVTYNVYADANGPQRPWALDLFPLIIEPAQWRRIEAGVRQRAALLERIMADVYGPQDLLREGLLPSALVHGHPGYLRALHGHLATGRAALPIIAFDLAHGPDGHWWVVSQRTQAPSGLGYLLENRLAVARLFPEAFEALGVQRLAASYRALVAALRAMAPAGEDAHVALLTPGPYNETYFEQAWLARYLGLTLVQGSDLTVRNERLYLRTLRGLEPVHVLLKRLDDEFLDPLELRADSMLGVPGLLQAVRAGHVAVANSPGSGFLESSALLGFLPAIAEHWLGEPLQLPALPTWWCGEDAALREALPRLGECVIKPTFRGAAADRFASVLGPTLSAEERRAWAERIAADGERHTLQRYLPLSQLPTWRRGALQPRSVLLRVFALADDAGSWRVLPGGLTRLGARGAGIASMQRGGSSADTWVLVDRERGEQVDRSSLLSPHTALSTLPQRRRLVTSHAAENLFWLGRYSERAENSVRLARITLDGLLGDAPSPELRAWLDSLARINTLVLPATPSATQARRDFVRALVRDLAGTEGATSVGFQLRALKLAASAVRERLSPQQWRLITDTEAEITAARAPLAGEGEAAAVDALRILDATSERLAAITGEQTDRMMRDDGWRLLSIGRHVERLGFLAGALAQGFEHGALQREDGFEAVLALFDSTISFHAQFPQRREVAPLLELLVLDRDNPRALAWVLKTLRARLSRLAQAAPEALDALAQDLPDPSTWTLDALLPRERGARPEALLQLLHTCRDAAWTLSDRIGLRYFNHSDVFGQSVGSR